MSEYSGADRFSIGIFVVLWICAIILLCIEVGYAVSSGNVGVFYHELGVSTKWQIFVDVVALILVGAITVVFYLHPHWLQTKNIF